MVFILCLPSTTNSCIKVHYFFSMRKYLFFYHPTFRILMHSHNVECMRQWGVNPTVRPIQHFIVFNLQIHFLTFCLHLIENVIGLVGSIVHVLECGSGRVPSGLGLHQLAIISGLVGLLHLAVVSGLVGLLDDVGFGNGWEDGGSP